MEFKGKYAFLSTMFNTNIVIKKDDLLKYSDENLHNYINNYLSTGFQFSSVEHAFQSLRLSNVDEFVTMLNTPNGFDAKRIGKTMKARKNWSIYRVDVMTFLNQIKYMQHHDLAGALAEIDETIHNDVSYKEYFWGRVIGENKGQDYLGKILNEERKAYKESFLEKKTVSKQKSINKGFNSKLNLQDEIELFMNNIKDKYFYVIDSETSGLDPRFWDIVELSAIKVDGNTLEVIDEFDEYINPMYKLPPAIVEFNKKNETGICDELLSTAPKAKEVTLRFNEFIGNNPIIMGQNIPFDIKFINKLYNKQFKTNFEYSGCMDTLKMAKEKIPGKHNLDVLYEMIPNKTMQLGFHKSIDDTKATLEVFKWLASSEYYIDLNQNNQHTNENNTLEII